MFTQKYTIICPIERLAEGQLFESTHWPLHTTIADTFAVNAMDEDFISQIQRLVKGQTFAVVGKELAYFGKNAAVEVMILQDSPELYTLHSDLIDLLLEKGAIFNDAARYAFDVKAEVFTKEWRSGNTLGFISC